MNAVNAALLFILVWTFTDVCQTDKDISVSCDNVTGSMGKEIAFTCSVSLQIDKCCIKHNTFSCEDSILCKLQPPNDCDKNKIFTCRHNSSTNYTEKCSFFVQTTCGWRNPELTVDISGYLRRTKPENPSGASDFGLKCTVIAVMSGSLILFIIIITYKTKPTSIKLSGFKKKMSQFVRHDVDNSDRMTVI